MRSNHNNASTYANHVYWILCTILLLLGSGYAYAFEPIPITVSHTMDKVNFDGKWSFEFEWKASSLNTYSYENGEKTIILRSAHQGDFVYVLLDAISDQTIDVGMDKALVCFDTTNNKNTVADLDDLCFMAVLGSDASVYQGDTVSGFEKITNPDGFIAKSSVSDENDRYSGIPHATYEFKIPTDFIGRSSVYGFNFAVYDENAKKFYTYPDDIATNDGFSSPAIWGEIYSPDKSLPEFYVAPMIMVLSIASVILITRIKRLV